MRERFETPPGRVAKEHRYLWLWEPLETDSGFALRAMFGAKAVYLDGKLMVAFVARDEPWQGMLVATEHCHHAALVAEFPELVPHPILPKWLYLPETAASFERSAARLVALAKRRDPRIGVVPKPKRERLSKAARRSAGFGRMEGPSPDGPRPVGRRALQKDSIVPVSTVGPKTKSAIKVRPDPKSRAR